MTESLNYRPPERKNHRRRTVPAAVEKCPKTDIFRGHKNLLCATGPTKTIVALCNSIIRHCSSGKRVPAERGCIPTSTQFLDPSAQQCFYAYHIVDRTASARKRVRNTAYGLPNTPFLTLVPARLATVAVLFACHL